MKMIMLIIFIVKYKKLKNKTVTSKSFECKTKIIENTPNNNNIIDPGVLVPLKYSSNI